MIGVANSQKNWHSLIWSGWRWGIAAHSRQAELDGDRMSAIGT